LTLPVGDERDVGELLGNEGDAVPEGLAGRAEADRTPFEEELSLIGADDASGDLREGRLPGTVLTDHRNRFAAAKGEVDV
jgi:hypothetical protein